MKVTVKDLKGYDDLKVVEIEGEIDVYNSMELKRELNELIDKGNKNFILNLEKVSYMDSSGLGILVAILKKVKMTNGNLKIVKLKENIKKIFELTKLVKFFEIFEDTQDALKSF